jgi:hypothetical protein
MAAAGTGQDNAAGLQVLIELATQVFKLLEGMAVNHVSGSGSINED